MSITNRISSFTLSLIPAILYVCFLVWFSSTHYNFGGRGVETDFYWDYAPAADAILRGELPIKHMQFRGPGYPLVLALLSIPFDTFTAGKIVSILSAGISITLFAFLLIRKFGTVFGYIGVLTLMLNGIFLEYSIRVGTDMFFLTLNILAVFLLVQGVRPIHAGLAGLVAGWAFLTRYNGIALLVALGIWVCYLLVKLPGQKLRALYAGLGMIIPVALWLSIFWINNGYTLPTSNRANTLYEVEQGVDKTWEKYWYGKHVNVDFGHPKAKQPGISAYLNAALQNLTQNTHDDMDLVTGEMLSLLALSGVVLVIFGRGLGGLATWGLIAGMLNFGVLLFVFHSPRFSLYLIPFYIISALVFLNWLVSLIPKSRSYLRMFSFGFVVLCLVLTPPPVSWADAMRKFDHSQDYLLQAATTIGAKNLTEGVLTSRKPHLAYLLNRQFVPLPILNNSEELLDWMKTAKIRFCFIDMRTAVLRPGLARLVHPDGAQVGLKAICSQSSYPNWTLWELLPTKLEGGTK